jgi:LacI family transcriptional regulator
MYGNLNYNRDMTASKPRSKRPSMKDVAELAGVSRTTVSFVLNGKPGANISDETQQRVFQAAATLSYRPNIIAQNLRAQRTNSIGFISDVIGTTPYAGQILQGAQDAAWTQSNLLISINTNGDDDIKHVAVNTLLDRRVDGIIYATMWHREAHPPEALREVPTVLLDCFAADGSYPSVVPNEVAAARSAVTYLLERGHRRIGFIRDQSGAFATFKRLEGYVEALDAWGLAYDPALVWTGGSSLPSSGYEGMSALMQLPERPTAVFCYNDRMAMGGYDALRQLGLRIPEDVAVVGFDNHELIAAYLYPALTTMQLPHYEMGQWAVRHLLKLIDDPSQQDLPVAHVQIECPLIERDST